MAKVGARIILVFSAVFLFPPTGTAANNCVECHQKLLPSVNRAHDYAEWVGSRHAEKGITCEMCHGGNPAKTDVPSAHKGILKSSSPQSPLYFNRIPETCGRCHSAELAEFKKSYHYRELQRTGQGPNCVTCHGAMAARIPEPAQLKETCSVCHKERPVADEALVTLNLANQAVENLDKAVDVARKAGKEAGPAGNAQKTLQNRLSKLKTGWHSFILAPLAKEARQIADAAREEEERLRLTTGTEGK
ncbi:MAG: hypothetical protein HYU99_10675 [Deltaproteobacteria bacterium]|nr:hypothetical protein [Deltaproteobacteria bacterium]